MKPLTVEWVQKAEEDFAGAVQMNRQTLPNLICFHCQQCAEKYLKARLYEAGIDFPKTHDLLNLLKLVLPVEPLWETARDSLRRLNEYAIEFRYPGDNATPEEAEVAMKHCICFRGIARHSLGLDKPPQPPLRVREKKANYCTKKRT
jgi:HEPN domain-containing protein